MRRIFFMKDMVQAIREGRKSSTTRNRPLVLEDYLAITGPRFSAKPFAVIHIDQRQTTKWTHVIEGAYDKEGFNSPAEMRLFLKKNLKITSEEIESQEVFFHRFHVVKLLE